MMLRKGLRWQLAEALTSKRLYRYIPLSLRRWAMRPWIKPLPDSVFQPSPFLLSLRRSK